MTWPASIKTWLAGESPSAATLNAQIRDPLKAIGDPWTAYTPVWGSSGAAPSLGNGTITGAYRQAGNTADFRILLTAGSTTTYGTGFYTFTFPVAAILANQPGGSGFITRSGPLYWGLIPVGFGTTSFRMIGSGASALFTATSPATLTTGDQVCVGGTIEAA